MPLCDQTGIPDDVGLTYFHSSTISGSATRMISRTLASILPRQSLSSFILASKAVSLMPFHSRILASHASSTSRFHNSRLDPKGWSEVYLLPTLNRRLRHFAAHGSANKYRPVKNSRASTNTAERPNLFVYLCWATAMPLTTMTAVKAIDSQRCVSRIHLLQFNAPP